MLLRAAARAACRGRAAVGGRARWLSQSSGPSGARPQAPAGGQPAKPSLPSPVPTATTFFMLTNPELYLNPKSAGTWKMVAAVWIIFGSYTGYLFYEDWEKDKAKEREFVGPRRPDASM